MQAKKQRKAPGEAPMSGYKARLRRRKEAEANEAQFPAPPPPMAPIVPEAHVPPSVKPLFPSGTPTSTPHQRTTGPHHTHPPLGANEEFVTATIPKRYTEGDWYTYPVTTKGETLHLAVGKFPRVLRLLLRPGTRIQCVVVPTREGAKRRPVKWFQVINSQ